MVCLFTRASGRRWLKRLGLGLVALVSTIVVGLGAGNFVGLAPAPAHAQLLRVQEIAERFYRQLPNFPKENQYVSKRTNQIDRENTLIWRLIQYHTYVKGRSPAYRFDWKITLADYLGLHEPMLESTYPGRERLKTNPLKSDRVVINRLNQTQRNQLVQVLVDVHTGRHGLRAQPPPSPAPTLEPGRPSQTSPSLQPAQPGARFLLSP